MINRVIGTYHIVEKLGAGGMGLVYRAVDQAVHRNVAIKVVRLDGVAAGTPGVALVERFRSEARAMAALNHPAITTLYTFLTEGDECFLVMEYVPGRNLAQVIESHGPIPWREASEIVVRVLSGLRHAHQHGVIHRDLKPSNILLGNDGTVKLTDFGIARMHDGPRLTGNQGVIGTIEYMAPELLQGREPGTASDIYSMGVVLYEAIVGKAPFYGRAEYDLVRAKVEEDIPPPSTLNAKLPDALERLLMSAVARDAEKRPADAAEFSRELRAVITTTSGMPSNATVSVAGVAVPDNGEESRPAFSTDRFVAKAKETAVQPPEPPRPQARETVASRQAAPTMASPITTASPLTTAQDVPRQDFRPPNNFSPPPGREAKLPPSRKVQYVLIGASAAVLLAGGAYFAGRPQPTPAPLPPQAAVVTPTSPASTPTPTPGPAPVSPSPSPTPTPAPTPAPTPPAPTPEPPKPKPEPPQTIASLADVHSLFLRPGPSQFEALLTAEIVDKLNGKMQIIAAQGAADAILSVVFRDDKGTTLANRTDDLDKLKGTILANATIRARQSGKVLWTGEANDKRSLVGSFGNKTRRLASRLAEELRDARH